MIELIFGKEINAVKKNTNNNRAKSNDKFSDRSKIKVATILDEFSYTCFRYECNLIYLDPDTWREKLIKEKPNLLFVESFWRGINGKWRNMVRSNVLKEIVIWCKKNNIPTVFWNKEDPVHYKRFIEIAKLFDVVFTTDANCIKDYKKILKHKNVYCLPFAAQPKMHNPINRNKERLGQIAFAGSWHSKGHNERIKDMNIILKPSLKYNISIYDRNNRIKNNPYCRFPQIYQPYIKGALKYKDMVKAYKKYDIFLNVNSVKKSPTMFSRRVFELLACGTNVISGYSVGIGKMFDKIVLLSKTKEDTMKNLKRLLNDKVLRERLALLGQREIFKNHTYEDRFKYILDKVGIDNNPKYLPGISIISWLKEMNDIDNVLQNYLNQTHDKKELLIIILDDSINLKNIKERIYKYDDVKILSINNAIDISLSSALEKTKYKQISFFSPHSYYGKNFLEDLINSFKYVDADIVGKSTYYNYFEKNNKLCTSVLNNEYEYVDYLNWKSMIIKRDLLSKVKISNLLRSDFDLVFQDCKLKGIKMFSLDRFNYVEIISNCSDYKVDYTKYLKESLEKGHIENYKDFVSV